MNNYLKKILKTPKALIGIIIILGVVITALFAPYIAPVSPYDQNVAKRLMAPSFLDEKSPYPLGTDALGRDILSRIIYGSRISLVVSLASVLGAGLLGAFLGIFAGFFGGRADSVIMRIVDTWMAIPQYLLVLGGDVAKLEVGEEVSGCCGDIPFVI